MENKCSICMEDIIYDKKILDCKHSFHKKCIKKWFNTNHAVDYFDEVSCPLCRQLSILDNEDEWEVKNTFSNVIKLIFFRRYRRERIISNN